MMHRKVNILCGNLSNLFQFHNPLIYQKTNSDSILGMAMSKISAPQETLTQGNRRCHTIGKVEFHIQCQGTTVHKDITVLQDGSVLEILIGPVYRPISDQSRNSKNEEEHFSRIGDDYSNIFSNNYSTPPKAPNRQYSTLYKDTLYTK